MSERTIRAPRRGAFDLGQIRRAVLRQPVAMRRLAFLLAMAALGPARAADAPDGARRAELVSLVRQDCGSCHGMTLKGGLGPSLEPAALAGKDAGQLQFVILNGVHGTPMPPWRPFLTDTEARWIVEQLRQGFPK